MYCLDIHADSISSTLDSMLPSLVCSTCQCFPRSPCLSSQPWSQSCACLHPCLSPHEPSDMMFMSMRVASTPKFCLTRLSNSTPLVQEASTLLSALAAALSNCHLAWPAFLPVHDPLRDAYWGIGAAGLATAHYDSDSIHLSKNPSHLQQVCPALCFA